MSEINSPLGRRTFASSNQKTLTIPNGRNIPDESQYSEDSQVLSNDESQYFKEPQVLSNINEIQSVRNQKIIQSKKISNLARERIQILCNLGRCTETFEFEGVKFSIRSLTKKEIKDVVFISSQAANSVDSYFIARDHTLAKSLYEIDGKPLSVILGSHELEDILNLFDEMDENVIHFIHNKYLDMIEKNKYKFIIKNEQDGKEVSEDIKK